ncbi:hypothetical protein KCP75_26230 (plasmid) [Salmonella enterica subsp. enterica]|nr:hypothetical protein KCP73_27235 [Salmonella enterica subsp. enterica]QUJ02652.1 hypothetical protein KCP75_26230 [Salmonella enterica subsp. enterica]
MEKTPAVLASSGALLLLMFFPALSPDSVWITVLTAFGELTPLSRHSRTTERNESMKRGGRSAICDIFLLTLCCAVRHPA